MPQVLFTSNFKPQILFHLYKVNSMMTFMNQKKLWPMEAKQFANYFKKTDQIRISDEDWRKAYELKSDPMVLLNEDNHYFVRRSESRIEREEMVALCAKFEGSCSAEEIREFYNNIAVVAPSKIFENFYTCTCPVGARREICKH